MKNMDDPLPSCVPRPASSPPPAGGGLSSAVLRAALHPRSALPPPRRVGLRFPTPIGHGRGLVSLPGWADQGGKASACLGCISLPQSCVATAPRRLRPLVSARLHPRPGKRRSVPAASPAASRCLRCSRLSLSASGNAVPTQTGLVQANIASISIGVNRLPSSFALLGRGFTMPTVCANACHRPSIHRGSRLGFYRLRLLP